MKIFDIESGVAKPTIEVLLIYPFKEIWERDSSKTKSQAIKEFSYIEFMCSPKKTNPYYGYPESERGAKVAQGIFKTGYTPDGLVQEGMRAYLEFLDNASPSLSLLRASTKAIDQLTYFLENLNLAEKNPKSGTPLYKPKEITSALADLSVVARNLNELQEKVSQEIYESVKTKGNKDINYYEE